MFRYLKELKAISYSFYFTDSGDKADQDYISLYDNTEEDNHVEDMDIGDSNKESDDGPDPDFPNAEVYADADNTPDGSRSHVRRDQIVARYGHCWTQ